MIRWGTKNIYLEYDPHFDCEYCGVCCRQYWKKRREYRGIEFYLIEYDTARYESLGKQGREILAAFNQYETKNQNDNSCPFLEEEGSITKCKIHDIKPVICWGYNCQNDRIMQNRRKHAARPVADYSINPSPLNKRRKMLLGRLITMIEQVEADWDQLPFEIKEIYVFGSMLTQKVNPHDIDVLIIYGDRRTEILSDEEMGAGAVWEILNRAPPFILGRLLKQGQLLKPLFDPDLHSFQQSLPDKEKSAFLKVWSKEECGTGKWKQVLADTF